MPRPPRILLPHSYYHVMTRGNNRNVIFRQPDDFDYYLELVGKYKDELPFDLFHYCLMPNHTHFLIRTKRAEDFSIFMKKLDLAYFHYFNKVYGWVGHFWQDRYKSQAVGNDEYFIQCGKYIELNPVRAGLVGAPEEYFYSSGRYYIFGAADSLITEDLFYKGFGESLVERQRYYRDMVVDELILEGYKKPVWGSNSQRHNEKEKARYYHRNIGITSAGK